MAPAGLLAQGPTAEAAGTSPLGATATVQLAVSNNTFERQVQRQVNLRREARDLRPVRLSDCLDQYAEDWAQKIALTGLMVHRDQSIILAGCDLSWAGEALARGKSLTPKSTVKRWMNSPGHRAVILKGRANRGGLGVRKDGEGRIVVVLNFGDK